LVVCKVLCVKAVGVTSSENFVMFSSTDETYFEVLDKSVSQFCKQAFNDAEFIASSVNSIIINADYIDSAFIR